MVRHQMLPLTLHVSILLKHIQNLSAQGLKLRKMVSDSTPETIHGQATQIAAEHDFQISQSPVNDGNSGGFQEVAGGIIARKAVSYTHLTLPTIYSV